MKAKTTEIITIFLLTFPNERDQDENRKIRDYLQDIDIKNKTLVLFRGRSFI